MRNRFLYIQTRKGKIQVAIKFSVLVINNIHFAQKLFP